MRQAVLRRRRQTSNGFKPLHRFALSVLQMWRPTHDAYSRMQGAFHGF